MLITLEQKTMKTEQTSNMDSMAHQYCRFANVKIPALLARLWHGASPKPTQRCRLRVEKEEIDLKRIIWRKNKGYYYLTIKIVILQKFCTIPHKMEDVGMIGIVFHRFFISKFFRSLSWKNSMIRKFLLQKVLHLRHAFGVK